ncbi:MAG: hypothetical protein ACRDHF_04970 [Tepidiformaceae bacterium]
MFNAVPFTHFPTITEPTPEARFREEFANGAAAAVAEADSGTATADVEGMIARHYQRAAEFFNFS